MSFKIRGFVEIPSYYDNNPNAVALFGELSERSRTYISTDVQKFQDDNKDFSELLVFLCENGGVSQVCPQDAVDSILDVTQAMYSFDTVSTLVEQISNAFPETISNVATSNDVIHKGRLISNWISFDLNTADTIFDVKLWFSDSAFKTEYVDDFEIRVVPPVENVSNLYQPYVNANNYVNAFNQNLRDLKVMSTLNGDQATDISSVALQWVDKDDPENTMVLYWTFLGFGVASLSYENKIEALKKYLTDNTVWTVDEWSLYIPDLIQVDYLTFIPLWDEVALPSSVLGDSFYRASVNLKRQLDITKIFMETLTDAKALALTDTLNIEYKGLQVIAVGDENNQSGRTRMGEAYSDICDVRTGQPELSFVAALTRSMMSKLAVMAPFCENDDGEMTLPSNMTRITRGGVDYLESTENDFIIRMVIKQSYLSKV